MGGNKKYIEMFGSFTEPSIRLFLLLLSLFSICTPQCTKLTYKKLVPWGTDGRLPLSDLDLDLGSGHTAYRRASLIDL